MSCRLIVAGGEYEVAQSGGSGKIPVTLLELDADYSVYGERLAGLLLMDYELDCSDAGLKSRVEEAASRYRRRVAVEQIYDLVVRLGPFASEVKVRPSYAPLSRMNALSVLHGCRFEEYLAGPGALERLDEIYMDYLREVAEPAGGGWLRPKPLRAREAARVVLAALRGAGARLASIAPVSIAVVEPCQASGRSPLLAEPWRAVSAPEGVLMLGCPGPQGFASRFTGGRVRCKASRSVGSTLVCKGEGGVVAVKEYHRMAFKWVPARAVGTGFIKYRVTPKSRLAAEYRYFGILRSVAGTPRVHGVCMDYASALMAREYIEGDPVLELRDPEAWRLAARLLAAIHAAGYAVGDPNPGNIIVDREGRAHLIDAEQVHQYTPKAAAWDLAVFMTYARVSLVPLNLIEEALLEYREASGSAWGEVLKFLASPRLWLNLSVTLATVLEIQGLVRKLKS